MHECGYDSTVNAYALTKFNVAAMKTVDPKDSKQGHGLVAASLNDRKQPNVPGTPRLIFLRQQALLRRSDSPVCLFTSRG